MYIKSTYDGLHVITGTTENVSEQMWFNSGYLTEALIEFDFFTTFSCYTYDFHDITALNTV